MNILGAIKPEYFYQPHLLLRRVFGKKTPEAEFANVRLPWGVDIRVRPKEVHAKILTTLNAIDLPVTETLWRLVEPGEVTVDIGANIGYMTSILACRVSTAPGGCIWSFEANPEIFKELEYNIQKWRSQLPSAVMKSVCVAVSEVSGKATLAIPKSINLNSGLSHILDANYTPRAEVSDETTITVNTLSLDELFPKPNNIAVIKIDVEGHELSVLKGAKSLLREKRIRDCIFEEHGTYPTSVTSLFEEMGYSVFRLHENFFGPILLSVGSDISRSSWLPTSFLATTQPSRAIIRFKERGWKSLKAR